MPEQMVHIIDRHFMLHPEQKAEIDELREQGLPDEAAAILTAVAEKLALFETLETPPDELCRMVSRSCILGAKECYNSALEMAREVVGE